MQANTLWTVWKWTFPFVTVDSHFCIPGMFLFFVRLPPGTCKIMGILWYDWVFHLAPSRLLELRSQKTKSSCNRFTWSETCANIFCFLQNLLWFQASFFKDSNNKQNHDTLVNIRVQPNSPSWYNAFAEIRSSSLFWPSMSWFDSVSAILFFYCWVTLVGTCHINPLLGQ